MGGLFLNELKSSKGFAIVRNVIEKMHSAPNLVVESRRSEVRNDWKLRKLDLEENPKMSVKIMPRSTRLTGTLYD